MALREGPPSAVFTAQPDWNAFQQKRTKGETFGSGEVYRPPPTDSPVSRFDDTFQLCVDVKVLWYAGDALPDAVQGFYGN